MNALDVFNHWREVRRRLLGMVDQISEDHLTFTPREGLWDIGYVLRHIATSEDGWFRYAVQREISEWPAVPPAEAYPTVESIRELLDEVHARTRDYLATVDVSELDTPLALPWGAQTTRRWVIWHVIEHEIHHRGELSLMMGLLGLEGLDS
jgi:uncharacterized damage-inducible protein DinB